MDQQSRSQPHFVSSFGFWIGLGCSAETAGGFWRPPCCCICFFMSACHLRRSLTRDLGIVVFHGAGCGDEDVLQGLNDCPLEGFPRLPEMIVGYAARGGNGIANAFR